MCESNNPISFGNVIINIITSDVISEEFLIGFLQGIRFNGEKLDILNSFVLYKHKQLFNGSVETFIIVTLKNKKLTIRP